MGSSLLQQFGNGFLSSCILVLIIAFVELVNCAIVSIEDEDNWNAFGNQFLH